MQFNQWIDTLVEEKNLDTEQVFDVEGPSGWNAIPLCCIVDAMKKAPAHEQKAIKDMIVKLDFYNQPIVPYFEHLAQAIAY